MPNSILQVKYYENPADDSISGINFLILSVELDFAMLTDALNITPVAHRDISIVAA